MTRKNTPSSSKQRIKDQAGRLAAFLQTQSLTLSRTQSLEAVSHLLYGKPWNVVKSFSDEGDSGKIAGRHDDATGCTLVLPQDASALDVDQLMRLTNAGAYGLDVALSLNVWDLISNDVDALNDLVSERITGSIVGLEDISYSRFEGNHDDVAADHVLLRVVAEWAFDTSEPSDAYLPVKFAWVYPDEDGDSVSATVNRQTGEILLHAPVPDVVHDSSVRVRLESLDRFEMADVTYIAKKGTWKVTPDQLADIQDWDDQPD